jgi:hypothetical protein
VAVLVKIMGDKGAAATARTSAACALLDRAWGRPEQTLSASVVGEPYIDALKRIAAEDAEEVETLPEKALPAPIDD